MTKPTTLAGTKLLIMVGDGASPEVFAEPCGLTTKKFSLNAASSTTNVPDCDDPDAPSWTERDVTALSGQTTGSGVLGTESFAVWKEWAMSGESRNCRVKLNTAALGWFEGQFILSTFTLTGEKGTRMQVEVSLDSDGQLTWVDAT